MKTTFKLFAWEIVVFEGVALNAASGAALAVPANNQQARTAAAVCLSFTSRPAQAIDKGAE
ncbi:hypothetical protein D3C80_1865960 [compost metagenome]